MSIGKKDACLVAASAFAMLITLMPAHALTMQECSAKYQAAKSTNTLSGQSWNDFRKTQCGDTATTTTAAPATAAATKPAAAPKPAAATGNAVFPNAIAPKYASEKPAKARRDTCLDQYRLNKANNGNGNLKWIQKGGGYYSECNKRLKG